MAKETDRFDEPIWKLEVEYEALLRAVTAHSTYIRASELLYDLLSAHPNKTMPADITTADVQAWADARLADGYALRTVLHDLEHIHAFFKWLRETKGILLTDPTVEVFSERRPR